MPLDDGTELTGLFNRFFPFLLERAWGTALASVGVELAWDLDLPEVQEILEDMTLKHVQSIIKTTLDDVRRLAGQAADEGWSAATQAERLRELGVTASKTRAEAIAVTASAEAMSRGSLLAYARSGVVRGTEWLLAHNPCPEICEPLAGKVVPLGEEYAPGIRFPPAHVFCRCSLAPILEAA